MRLAIIHLKKHLEWVNINIRLYLPLSSMALPPPGQANGVRGGTQKVCLYHTTPFSGQG
jgi:hypothetical protein